MHNTDILAQLIQKKRECLVQIAALGRRQWEIILNGDMTTLLDVLAVKQRVLLELQRTERAMDPYRDEAPEQRRWRTPELRQCCADQLQECVQLLQDIVRQEKQSEQELTRRRDEAAVRLEGFHQANHARVAYTAQPAVHVSQLDLSSDV